MGCGFAGNSLRVSLHGRGDYTKSHGLFHLQLGTVEAFKAIGRTEHKSRYLRATLELRQN